MSRWAGAILIGGTSSDAGKSLVVAGLCRLLHRNGVSVAPFKAQNMSNNSVVTTGGGEIGRAQYMQAQACGLIPSVRHNPVLLKPGSDRRSQVVVRGQARGSVGARDYHRDRSALAAVVAEELAALRDEFDVVVVEGAGSVAEVNLRGTDIANMGLAQAADIPVVVVGDIDRGGVLAHLIGTVAALNDCDQRRVQGFIVNKFRGDPSLLTPGLDAVGQRTGRPVLGVLPYSDDLWLDAEDSLGTVVGGRVGPPSSAPVALTVAAIRLPRISNTTDVEALAVEPGVDVRWVDDPASVLAADLVVVPGSKATVSDLQWLRARGLDSALVHRAQAQRPILAICGGFQMLTQRIVDDVESGIGAVDGIGLLDCSIEFASAKTLRQVDGIAWGTKVSGYEIHHGQVAHSTAPPLVTLADGTAEGACVGRIAATHLHGVLSSDIARRAYLTQVAADCGRSWRPDPGAPGYQAQRAAQWDVMADLIDAHIDLPTLSAIIGGRAPTPDNLTLSRSRLS